MFCTLAIVVWSVDIEWTISYGVRSCGRGSGWSLACLVVVQRSKSTAVDLKGPSRLPPPLGDGLTPSLTVRYS